MNKSSSPTLYLLYGIDHCPTSALGGKFEERTNECFIEEKKHSTVHVGSVGLVDLSLYLVGESKIPVYYNTKDLSNPSSATIRMWAFSSACFMLYFCCGLSGPRCIVLQFSG